MILSELLNISLQHRLPVTCFYPQIITLRIANLSLGYLANFVVIFVIFASPALWNPRNLFWLAVCCADVVIALYHSLELISFYLQSTLLCQIGTTFLSVPFASLLSILTLAAIDRHLAIQNPFWHRSHVTNTRVILGILITWFFVVATITAPYWSGLLPVGCVVHLFHHQVIWMIVGVLSVVCISLHLTVYCSVRRRWRQATRLFHTDLNSSSLRTCCFENADSTRHLFPHRFHSFRSVSTKLTQPPHTLPGVTDTAIPYVSPSHSNEFPVNNPITTSQPNGCFPILCPSVSQLEMRAAVNITLGMIPFWIFTLPIVGNFVGFFFCDQVNLFRCSSLCVLTGYGKDFYLLHCLYNPCVYVLRSSEFHLAWRRLSRRGLFSQGREGITIPEELLNY